MKAGTWRLVKFVIDDAERAKFRRSYQQSRLRLDFAAARSGDPSDGTVNANRRLSISG